MNTTLTHVNGDGHQNPKRADPHSATGDGPLAHHFDSMPQQFEAAKLGMWLFLGTEILLFGGLFCLYAIFRSNHPDVFAYGAQFLDTRLGALNTSVLILSSMTMAIAVWAVQTGRRLTLINMLILSFIGGSFFMAIKFIEYNHKFHEGLVWGSAFYDEPHDLVPFPTLEPESGTMMANLGETSMAADDPVIEVAGDATRGVGIWDATCRSCHGAQGEGVPGQGKEIQSGIYTAALSDDDFLAFIKIGRTEDDPLNTTGILMPPKGGNPLLSDGDLRDVIAYVRAFSGDGAGGGNAPPPVATSEFWIPMSSIPDAPTPPTGIVMHTDSGPTFVPHHSIDPERPANAHMFFGLYFMLTGLHGFHVLVGMLLMLWLLFRSIRGDFSSRYYTPVDLASLYWHIVDVIWIFLFPLLYLIPKI